jgi:retron-type reverse transcriptase
MQETPILILESRCNNDADRDLINSMKDLLMEQFVSSTNDLISIEEGLPQGSVLSPVLLNVYLEHLVKESQLCQ